MDWRRDGTLGPSPIVSLEGRQTRAPTRRTSAKRKVCRLSRSPAASAAHRPRSRPISTIHLRLIVGVELEVALVSERNSRGDRPASRDSPNSTVCRPVGRLPLSGKRCPGLIAGSSSRAQASTMPVAVDRSGSLRSRVRSVGAVNGDSDPGAARIVTSSRLYLVVRSRSRLWLGERQDPGS